jgi:hypothetical protein
MGRRDKVTGERRPATAGWYGDAFDRFDRRYWDGGQWTDRVQRGGVEHFDPVMASIGADGFTRERIISARLTLLNLFVFVAVLVGLDLSGILSQEWNVVIVGASATAWRDLPGLDSKRWHQLIGWLGPDPGPDLPDPPPGRPQRRSCHRGSSPIDRVSVYLRLREGQLESHDTTRSSRPYLPAIAAVVGLLLIASHAEGPGIFLSITAAFRVVTSLWSRRLLHGAQQIPTDNRR